MQMEAPQLAKPNNHIYFYFNQGRIAKSDLNDTTPGSKIIFIAYSWGGHQAILQSYDVTPNILITIDPVVSKIIEYNGSDLENKIKFVLNTIFRRLADLFLNLIGEITGIASNEFKNNNIRSIGREIPQYSNYWFNVRATVQDGARDEGPIYTKTQVVKVCPLGKCYVLFTYNVPWNSGWSSGDWLAYLGGKYYDYPDGKATLHIKINQHHDYYAYMLRDILKIDPVNKIFTVPAGWP